MKDKIRQVLPFHSGTILHPKIVKEIMENALKRTLQEVLKILNNIKPNKSVLSGFVRLRNRAQIPVFTQHDIQAPHDFFLFFHVQIVVVFNFLF